LAENRERRSTDNIGERLGKKYLAKGWSEEDEVAKGPKRKLRDKKKLYQRREDVEPSSKKKREKRHRGLLASHRKGWHRRGTKRSATRLPRHKKKQGRRKKTEKKKSSRL